MVAQRSNHLDRAHVARAGFRLSSSALALLAASCAMPMEGGGPPGEADRDVAASALALSGGTPLSTEEYSGVVALQVWSVTLNSYATFCTGTLMTNNAIVTAAHCMQGDIATRTVYAKMGSQRLSVSRRILHSSRDVAVLQTSTKFWMWNWKGDHLVTPQGAITQNDYVRAFRAGTNASMDGQQMLCLGYGGANWQTGPFEPSLKFAVFTADYPTSFTGWGGVIAVDMVPTTAESEGGDSGGPCLDSINTVIGKLSVIMTSELSTGIGADDFAWWAIPTISGL